MRSLSCLRRVHAIRKGKLLGETNRGSWVEVSPAFLFWFGFVVCVGPQLVVRFRTGGLAQAQVGCVKRCGSVGGTVLTLRFQNECLQCHFVWLV